jgi:release factor glutamine methyltransferase
MSQAEPWTIGRLLNWTAQYLKGHGSETPRLDAEVLLAHVRGCSRIDLYTAFDQEPGEEAKAAFRELVRRRAQGEPVAYLVGRREFYSLSFRVTPDVLIPRPETEFVVIALLDAVKERAAQGLPVDALQIADVGTGSGILAICAAKEVPGSHVTALDISPAALAVAKQNVGEHGVMDRIEFVHSDLFTQAPAERQFDFILSNPPYITEAEMSQLPPTVRDHEPRAALGAGERGLDTIAPLIAQSAERLRPGGSLICEISPMLRTPVAELLRADSRWQEPKFIKDLVGHVRVFRARLTPSR